MPQKASSQLTEIQQTAEALGLRHRIAFAFSPKKTVAVFHFMADQLVNPDRVEHPLFFLRGMMAVLWMADAKHFQVYCRPVTGTRWQAYPQGPIPRDVLALLDGDPLWLAELPETHFSLPFGLQGERIGRNLRVPLIYDPKKYLSSSDRTVLKAALVKLKDLKLNNRESALRSEAYQLTPLYEDIRWELLLPAKLQTKKIIDDLVIRSRHAVL